MYDLENRIREKLAELEAEQKRLQGLKARYLSEQNEFAYNVIRESLQQNKGAMDALNSVLAC